MNKQNHIESTTSTTKQYSWLGDLSMLVKLRLNLFVVMSAVGAAVVASGGDISLSTMLRLAVGGFLVTAAGAILNQVLEVEFDKKMDRTKGRPLPGNRIKPSTAVLFAGLTSLGGIVILATFNPITSFLGMVSLIAYAFVYTPLKRYHYSAVHFGAIPGALPMAIGVIAIEGSVTPLAFMLFSIQFLWQMPHFWAIAWVAHDDYSKAGFKLLPTSGNKKNREVGLHALLYSGLLIPLSFLFYWMGTIDLMPMVALVLLSTWYTYKSFRLYYKGDDTTARILMFSSFIYLPIALLILIIGSIL